MLGDAQSVSSDVRFDALLMTKLRIPRLPVQHIARPHLLALLEQGSQKSLTLIAAPAGSGKTTLLAEWALATSTPVSWLALEVSDNDPTHFLSYLSAALASLDERAESVSQESLPIQPQNWEPILIGILNGITRSLKQDAVLLLDDYHLISTEIIHTIMRFLLEHLPDHLHIVIGTRVNPPLTLARLRVHNQICELGAEDLDFTFFETEVFAHAMGLALTAEATHLLKTSTEGWIAGVQLLTLALRGHEDATDFLRQSGPMHHFLREYIEEEILGQQTAEMQRFLLHTCLLERLCGPLFDALLEEKGSQKRLIELRKANLFISALDETGTWYRYHPLFAEALVNHLRAYEPERISELYRRASNWYEGQQRDEEACDYAFLADDQPHAALLVERLLPRLLEQGKFLRLGTWIGQLSPEMTISSPLLFIASLFEKYLRNNVSGNAEQKTWLLLEQINQEVEKYVQNTDPLGARLRHSQTLLRAMSAMFQGDMTRAIALASETMPVSTEATSDLDKIVAVLQRIILGNAYSASGKMERAEELLQQPILAQGTSPTSHLNFARLPVLINLYEAQGRLHEMAYQIETLLHIVELHQEQQSIIQHVIHRKYAELLYEWDRLPEAMSYVQQVLAYDQTQEYQIPFLALSCLGLQVRIARAQGDDERVQQLLSADVFSPAHYRQLPEQGKKLWDSILVRLPAGSDDRERSSYGESIAGIHFDDPLPPHLTGDDYNAYITLARSLANRAREQHALPWLSQELILLEKLASGAAAMECHGWLIEIQILTALALYAQGKVKRALMTLGQALARAEAEGYLRLFADEGQPMALLLAQVDAFTTASHSYIQRIQAATRTLSASAITSSRTAQSPKLPEALSPREQEVLTLLAQGFTNQQIAEQLVISLNTAKRHIKHLLAKLTVTNRTQAVIRARELHLL